MKKHLFKELMILLCIALSIFSSCSTNDSRQISMEEQHKIRRSKYDSIVQVYTRNYDVEYDWSRLNYKFTIQYDTIINSSKPQIIKWPEFYDLYIENDSCFVSVYTQGEQEFHFILNVSDELFRKLSNDLLNNTKQTFLRFLVVKINEIKKRRFGLDISTGDNNDLYVSDGDNIFYGSGVLLDYNFHY